MRKTLILGLALIVSLALVSCGKKEAPKKVESKTATKTDGMFTIALDKISFSWNVDGDKLKGKLNANTKGWVGVGFNPSKQMKDATFVIGYVKDGKATVVDHHGTSNRQHKDDEAMGGKSNILESAGTESDKGTEITFTVPLKSGDSLDKEISANENTVLLAYGDNDRFVKQHVFRATLKVNLSSGQYSVLSAK